MGMNIRKYLTRVGIAELISLISTFKIVNMTHQHPASYSVYALFGGALFSARSDILSMLFVLFPMLLLCFTVVDYMQSDYACCCVYIFTRTNNRARWFAKKAVGLLCWIAVFYIMDFCLLYAADFTQGVSVDLPAMFILFVWTLLFNILAMFMLLLPMNLLAIKFGAVIAYLIGIGVYSLLLFTAIFSPTVAKWLPVSQGMYAWHDTAWTAQQKSMQSIQLPGFTISFSVIYMLIAVAAEAGVGILMIRKMDLLNLPEGEN